MSKWVRRSSNPHKRLHAFGATGIIVDQNTGAPVAGAIVVEKSVVTNGKSGKIYHSDLNGRFTIQPISSWHGAYLFGPISMSLLPGFDMPNPRRTILIEAKGYKKLEHIFAAKSMTLKIIGPETIFLQSQERQQQP